MELKWYKGLTLGITVFIKMAHNVLQLGDVADFGTLNFLLQLNLIWKTKLNINREPRHIAYVLL